MSTNFVLLLRNLHFLLLQHKSAIFLQPHRIKEKEKGAKRTENEKLIFRVFVLARSVCESVKPGLSKNPSKNRRAPSSFFSCLVFAIRQPTNQPMFNYFYYIFQFQTWSKKTTTKTKRNWTKKCCWKLFLKCIASLSKREKRKSENSRRSWPANIFPLASASIKATIVCDIVV